VKTGTMKPILIIKTGETFPSIKAQYGDFDDWIISGMQLPSDMFLVVPAYLGVPLPPIDTVSAAIITGSHSMVTDSEIWSENSAVWLSEAVDKKSVFPILGICYGHQLLAHAMGGKVGFHDKGREIGTATITKNREANDDPLFSSLPSEFSAHVSHSQSVISVPHGATILAHNSFESCHAFVLNDGVWGVQFHPEFTEDIVKAYILEHEQNILKEGNDPEQILASVRYASCGKILLRRFYDFVCG